jgi:hypothetical protein
MGNKNSKNNNIDQNLTKVMASNSNDEDWSDEIPQQKGKENMNEEKKIEEINCLNLIEVKQLFKKKEFNQIEEKFIKENNE